MIELENSNIKDAENKKRIIELGERIQLMLIANPQANILFDSNFKVMDCNPAAIKVMGFNSREDLFERFIEHINSNRPKLFSNGQPSVSVMERLAMAAADGHAEFEDELLMDGILRTYSVEMKRIPYEESFIIVVYILDITDIRHHEQELIKSREQNELQLTKLNLILKGTKIGLWDMEINNEDIFNPVNTITWSEEFRQLLDYTDESEFPNVIGSINKSFHPDDAERIPAILEIFLRDKTGKTPYDVEYRLKNKNGEYRYFRATGIAIRDKDGNPLRVAGAIMDMTDAKNLINEAEKQRIEAETANKAKSAFLSTMSHEIRTPMNAILGITEIQLQNESLNPEIRIALEKIFASGDMLLGIINDILDLSKIEAGKLELLIDKYNIASLVSDTVQLNMMRIGSKQIEFELNVDENIPAHMLGDELRIKQILNNLLSNAFKYTNEGTVTLSINSETDAGNENNLNNIEEKIILVLNVIDTGQGMSKEQISKLFDEYARFNQTANRITEGTGLGMSITRNLISMMNGTINVESQLGKGSFFSVRLPQIRIDENTIGREMAESLNQFRTQSRAQMKRVQITREPMPYGSVLIVDDVEINIYVAQGLLSSYELKIDTAASGFAAIKKIKDGKIYDVIFMDHMMPNLDGIETTKILRGMGYTNPIVALTANAVAGQSEIFFGNGFDDFISKPIDIRQMNVVLNKLIRDKHPPEVIEAARKQAKIKQPLEITQDDTNAHLVKSFLHDASKLLAAIKGIVNNGAYDDNEMKTYVINTHGIKSALANIGKKELSAAALKLELAGREKNIDVIKTETPAFLSSLQSLIEELSSKQNKAAGEAPDEDRGYLREKLLEIKSACEEYDENTAEKTIEELRKKSWSEINKKILEQIDEALLHSEFDEIINIVNEFIKSE